MGFIAVIPQRAVSVLLISRSCLWAAANWHPNWFTAVRLCDVQQTYLEQILRHSARHAELQFITVLLFNRRSGTSPTLKARTCLMTLARTAAHSLYENTRSHVQGNVRPNTWGGGMCACITHAWLSKHTGSMCWYNRSSEKYVYWTRLRDKQSWNITPRACGCLTEMCPNFKAPVVAITGQENTGNHCAHCSGQKRDLQSFSL